MLDDREMCSPVVLSLVCQEHVSRFRDESEIARARVAELEDELAKSRKDASAIFCWAPQ